MSPAVDDLPSWTARDRAQVAARARAWLTSDALRELIAHLAGPSPLDLRALQRWSAAHLDTRRGTERRHAAAVTWSEEWVDALIAAAGPLGLLRTPSPACPRYDVVLCSAGQPPATACASISPPSCSNWELLSSRSSR